MKKMLPGQCKKKQRSLKRPITRANFIVLFKKNRSRNYKLLMRVRPK